MKGWSLMVLNLELELLFLWIHRIHQFPMVSAILFQNSLIINLKESEKRKIVKNFSAPHFSSLVEWLGVSLDCDFVL